MLLTIAVVVLALFVAYLLLPLVPLTFFAIAWLKHGSWKAQGVDRSGPTPPV